MRILLAVLLSLSIPAFAETNFRIVCHVQDYICAPDGSRCYWGTVMGHEKLFSLVKNPAYPNPNYKNEVWEGKLTDVLTYDDGPSTYLLKVKTVITPEGQKSYSTELEYEWGDLAAKAGGASRVSVGVIDKKLLGKKKFVGRGYLCWGAELFPSESTSR